MCIRDSFIAMLVAVKCRYHLINNVVYINKIHNNARVIDANRQLAEKISWKNRAKNIEYICNKIRFNNETVKN